MTREEAIQIISIWLVSSKGTKSQRGYIEGWFDEDDEEAFRMAIEALSADVVSREMYDTVCEEYNKLIHQLSAETSTNTSTNTSTDLISRQDAIKEITVNPINESLFSADFIKRFRCGAKRQFQADVDEIAKAKFGRPTGEWIKVIDKDSPNETVWHYECDQCGAGLWEKGQRYCQNCGAKMKGDSND